MNIQKQRHDLHQHFIVCVPSSVSGTLGCSKDIQSLPWLTTAVSELNNDSYFSVLTCLFQREGKYSQDEDKSWPHIYFQHVQQARDRDWQRSQAIVVSPTFVFNHRITSEDLPPSTRTSHPRWPSWTLCFWNRRPPEHGGEHESKWNSHVRHYCSGL